MTDFRWNDLDLFATVREQASISRAATHLGLSQSTVSRRLEALEKALGTQLFDRTVDGVVPTKAAEVLVPLAEQMRQVAAQVSQRVHGLDQTIEGKVRVAMPEGITMFLVLPRLPVLRSAHPGIELEILAAVEHLDMARNEADLAVRLTRPPRGPFVVRRIGLVRYGVYIHKRFKRQAQLPALEWVTWTASHDHVPDAAWLCRTVPNAQRVLRLRSLVAIAFAVQAGVGAALLPRGIGDNLDDVIEIPTEVSTPEVPVWLVMHKNNRSIARIRAVADFLAEAAAEL